MIRLSLLVAIGLLALTVAVTSWGKLSRTVSDPSRHRQPMVVLLGRRTVASVRATEPANRSEAFPFVALQSGRAQQVRMYVDRSNRATTLSVGIYANAGHDPDKLLASGSRQQVTAGAWNTLTLKPARIDGGRSYWIAVLGHGGVLAYRDQASGRCRSQESRARVMLSGLQSRWPPGPSRPTCHVSVYVVGPSTRPRSSPPGKPVSRPPAPVRRPSANCTRTLPPASLGSNPYAGAALESALQSASGGSTICLSSGMAGPIDIYDVSPSSNVTVQPAPGATVTLGNIGVGANTHNLTFTGFSAINGVGIGSSGPRCCGNLSFAHDAFTGPSFVRDVVNSNIVFAHDTFNNINVCSSCYEGRIEVVSSTVTQPDGVVIENSVMSGGNSDGVQDDGIGTQILDNEFSNIIESSCGAIHCDAIQTVGAIGMVIAGNYFHNTTDCFLMDDGGANITIRGNECGPMAADSSFWIQAGGIKGLTLSHNTITATTGGAFGNDSTGSPSSNVTVTNNIEFSAPAVNPGQSLSGTTNERYNLVQDCGKATALCGGAHDVIGAPAFSGGRAPSTWAGFALSSGSLGIANASDGRNRGVSSFSLMPGP